MAHAYIPHLLADIAAGHQTERRIVPATGVRNLTVSEVARELERMRQESGNTLGYYSGLSAENFPPPEQLKDKEMTEVCKTLKKMMRSWNVKGDFPRRLPVRMMYTLLIKALGRRIDPESSFSVVFIYCSWDSGDCPLLQYCTCLKREKSGAGSPRIL